MTGPKNPVDGWFEKRTYTLDIAGLTDEERKEGSILLGGSAAEFVVPGDDFEYGEVADVVFNWGDPKAADVFAVMLEHDDRPDEFEDELIPFSATARLKDDIWSLVVQRKTFNPETDYFSSDQFIEIPFDAEQGYQVLHDAMEQPRPGPQMIGKVGIAWVLFEMGTSLKPLTEADIADHKARSLIPREAEPTPESDAAEDALGKVLRTLYNESTSLESLFGDMEIPVDEILKYAETLIKDWDFEGKTQAQNAEFTLNITHWLLETFAQQDGWGEFQMYPHIDKDGFEGEKLPLGVRHLVAKEYLGVPNFSDRNEIIMESDHQFVETQKGSLPESVDGMTFQQTVDFLRDNPEEFAKVQQTKHTHIPQVKITLRTAEFNGWDMEYKVSIFGVAVTPLIDNTHGTTAAAAFNYAKSVDERSAELSQTACELALLAAQNTNHVIKGTLPVAHLDVLKRRLSGDELIPVIKGRRIA